MRGNDNIEKSRRRIDAGSHRPRATLLVLTPSSSSSTSLQFVYGVPDELGLLASQHDVVFDSSMTSYCSSRNSFFFTFCPGQIVIFQNPHPALRVLFFNPPALVVLYFNLHHSTTHLRSISMYRKMFKFYRKSYCLESIARLHGYASIFVSCNFRSNT